MKVKPRLRLNVVWILFTTLLVARALYVLAPTLSRLLRKSGSVDVSRPLLLHFGDRTVLLDGKTNQFQTLSAYHDITFLENSIIVLTQHDNVLWFYYPNGKVSHLQTDINYIDEVQPIKGGLLFYGPDKAYRLELKTQKQYPLVDIPEYVIGGHWHRPFRSSTEDEGFAQEVTINKTHKTSIVWKSGGKTTPLLASDSPPVQAWDYDKKRNAVVWRSFNTIYYRDAKTSWHRDCSPFYNWTRVQFSPRGRVWAWEHMQIDGHKISAGIAELDEKGDFVGWRAQSYWFGHRVPDPQEVTPEQIELVKKAMAAVTSAQPSPSKTTLR